MSVIVDANDALGKAIVDANDAAGKLRRRTLAIRKLRDMVFKYVACGRSISRMQSVSREFQFYSEAVADSLYLPALFAAHYFQHASDFIDLVKSTGTVFCGYSVREYMYTLHVETFRLVIIANQQHVETFVDMVAREHYTLLERVSLRMDNPPTCGYPSECIRFARTVRGVKRFVSIQSALHQPLRVLLCTTRPYALQFCDGTGFVDLYANLGAKGPQPAFANGRHAHLLSARQLSRYMPQDVYDIYGEPGRRWALHIERWIGDSQSWIMPRPRNLVHANVVGQGWTVRLHVKRPAGTPYIHCWTDAHCRCLRHPLLVRSYVAPSPAAAYAKRVLDRMSDALAVAVGSPVFDAQGEVIERLDDVVREILQCVGQDEDYTFRVSNSTFSVEREGLTYE